MPAGTVNAIGLLVDCLLHNHIGTEAEQAYLRVLQKLHAATDGSTVGIAADDGLFDPLTIIGGTILSEGILPWQAWENRWALLSPLTGREIGGLVAGKTKVDILVTPITTITVGAVVGLPSAFPSAAIYDQRWGES